MSSQLIPYPVAYEGILSRPGMPSPLLLDAIRFAETGHLSPDKANKATSGAGAIGAYQLLQDNLHDMGYGVRPNITVQEARDPVKARQIAYDYITGYRDHHGFESIQDTLASYNMGANAYAKWKASGGDWNDLPDETKQYLVRASRYIERNPEQFNNAGSMMANFSQMQPQQQTQGSSSMVQPNPQPNPMNALMQSINNTQSGVNSMFGSNTQPNQPVMNMPYQVVPPNQDTSVNGSGLGQAILDAVGASPYSQYMNNGTVDMQTVYEPFPALLNEVGNTAAAAMLDEKPLGSGVLDAYKRMNASPDNAGSLATKVENVPTTQGGALTTGNRYRTPLSPSAPKAMDINEMLIRMGSAGLAQAANGGTAMMSAAGTEYGNLMDQQRTNALASYQASLSAKPDGNDSSKLAEQVAGYDQTLYDMQMAKGLLEQGGLTGFLQGTIGSGWDRVMGNPEAASRLLLKKLRVDDALIRVAGTKGAISNTEMKLFLSPTPSMMDDEQVWIGWINKRMQAITTIRNRVAQGIRVDPSEAATPNQVSQFTGTPQTLSIGVTVNKLPDVI